MKTVSSSSHLSKRLITILVVLLPILCGRLLAEQAFRTLIAEQTAYENQIIQPQVEETKLSLDFTIPSITTPFNYSFSAAPPFILDPIALPLLEDDYMTKKRSPFRAKKAINFSKELAKDKKEELTPLPYIAERNADPLILDPNLEQKKETKHDFLSKKIPLNIEGRLVDRSTPYTLKHPEGEESSLINRGFAHKKSETQLGSSLNELKTAHPSSIFVALEKKKDSSPSPMSEPINKRHFDADDCYFHYDDSFPITPLYPLENQYAFNEKLSRNYDPPEKSHLPGKCYFAKGYFKSLNWTDVSEFIEQKTQALLSPIHEEIEAYFTVNDIEIAFEVPEIASLSLRFDDIFLSFDFPYKSYKQPKTVIESPPLDKKTFERSSYLYVNSFTTLESLSHYYPTKEKATPLPSKYTLSEGPTLAMEFDRVVITFTLTPQFDLYCLEGTLNLPKKAQEFQESALATMHSYLYMEASKNSKECELIPKPEKHETLAFKETIESLNLNPSTFPSSPSPIEKKDKEPLPIISRSIEFPHAKTPPSSMEFSINDQTSLGLLFEVIEKPPLFFPSLEKAPSPNFEPKLNLDITPQKDVQTFAFSKQITPLDPTLKHLSFPKHHKKSVPSKLEVKGTYKGENKALEDHVVQNDYHPSIQKTKKTLSKSLPKFPLPKSKSLSLPLEIESNIAIAIQDSEIDYEKFANSDGGTFNPNELSLPYVRRKELSPKKDRKKANKLAEDIPGIESMTALVERTDPFFTGKSHPSTPSREHSLPLEAEHPLHNPMRPAYYPPVVPGLDIAATAPSMREKHLEYVKKKVAPSESAPDDLILPYIVRKRVIPNKPLMTPKSAFEDLSEADKVIALATRHENFPNSRDVLEGHPVPHRVKLDLAISEGEIAPIKTEMIRSQSKEILEDYNEENRLSSGLIALAHPELEGPPSESETRSLNQSNRFTRAFLTEIPPPSHLETISYNNEFNASVYYSKRDDGKGYLFSIKMKPGENLNFASPIQHYIFVRDGSSSIKKHRFGVFKEGVGRALSYLNEGDSFNIIVADTDLTSFSKTPASWSKESVSRAKHFLIDRNYRGFFINYDAFDLLSNVSNYFAPDKENVVVLITDGHSFKSIQHHKDDFKKLVKESKGKFSVFTATASQGNNLSMLDLLSTFNNGELMYSKTNASFSRQLAVLVKHIESFVAKDIHVNVTSSSQKTGIEFYPNEKTLPSLYADRPYIIYGSIDELKGFDLMLQGRCGDQWINIKQTISFKQAQKATHSIKKGIALQKAYVCYDYFLKNNDPFFLSEAQNILELHNVPTAVR